MLRSAWPFRVLSFALLLSAAGCGSSSSPSLPATSIGGGSASGNRPSPTDAQISSKGPALAAAEVSAPARPKANQHPEVLIQTSLGDIKVRLDAQKAPHTVDNFLRNYVDRGFYEQTAFHHVEKGFLIAAGGYGADLQPKPTRAAIVNEANNGLTNRRGSVAMARHPQYINSATSQFFINLADNAMLDHQSGRDENAYGYCVFGEVVQGMEVVDKIAEVEAASRGLFPKCPVEPVIIQTVKRLN